MIAIDALRSCAGEMKFNNVLVAGGDDQTSTDFGNGARGIGGRK